MSIISSPPSKWKGNSDGSISPKGGKNVRLENGSPSLVISETDQTLPAGLWRIIADGTELSIQQNTAAEGDFSTFATLIRFDPFATFVIGGMSLVTSPDLFPAALAFQDTLASAGDAYGGSLFRGTEDRPHFADTSFGDHVLAYTEEVVLTASYIVRETPSGTINGINDTFTLANTPVTGSEMVFVNGLLQDEGGGNDYTISSDTITFASAPLTGDKIRVTYLKA